MALTIYIICMGAGLVFIVGSLVAGQLFGGHHGHVDGSGGHAEAGADTSDSPGMSIFSPIIMAAFVTSFGGFGTIFHQIPATRSAWLSAPLAAVCAVSVTSLLLWLLHQLFRRTDSSSESKVGGLVGVSATVITPIPQHGVGEIAYVDSGSRYTAPARSESGCAVASGQTVKIHRVVGTQFYVVPL
ncbi:MAG TPA: NfeD family protein [Verrucomicrobiae bacterium]|nr:NfeD family protein [Verrucomicrobiae bacterium]